MKKRFYIGLVVLAVLLLALGGLLGQGAGVAARVLMGRPMSRRAVHAWGARD